ncbi:MAG: DEAD/DEAH box helicase [Kiritimatiellae bacterium]|nr:DEAD/DEAH box helicase [Kiritimatiellia bacterium]
MNTQKKFIHFLLDRTMGDVPRDGEEAYWDNVRQQLRDTWLSTSESGASLYAAPVLEGLFPYPSGAESVEQLQNEGVLEQGMENFIKPEIVRGEYNLYKHQADSIRVSGVEGKDIIVSSGTGSGKTECFLYSMINNLMRNHVDFNEPGVRILMIYPRNALVKDQLRRILDMVMGKNPRISVGMYIGETETGGDNPAPMSDWEIELQNSVGEDTFLRYYKRTRDEIRRNPPTILITNYSMLEWMMLRDKDRTIFALSRGRLQAIVLDEAHLYSGALGNDINMLIRRTLERFFASKDNVRFYATSATIGDGRPETLRNVASALFGVEENRIEAITGERNWPDDEIPVGGDFDDEEREQLAGVRHRLVADRETDGVEHGTKPKNFLKLTVPEVKLLARCTSDVTDGAGKCYLPYKLHTFMDIPKMVYSDLDVTAEKPLGNLQLTPIYVNGTRGVEVYSVTPRNSTESDIYFKTYLEEDAHPPFARRFSACPANKQLKPLYFRRRTEQDAVGFDLERSNTGWIVRERGAGEGTFVLARRNAAGGMWAGAAMADEWFLRDGVTALSVWGDGDAYAGSTLIPLGFVPQDMRLAAYTEMLFPELPPAEVPDGVDPDDFLYERSWQGRQMLVFSDSRARAASTAPTLQGNHQRELIKNCIYRELNENGECKLGDIAQLVFDQHGNEFHLSQNLYGLEEPDQVNLKRDFLIPSLAFCALAISSDTRSLEDVGAICCLPFNVPCPNGHEKEALFGRLIVPGVDEPTVQQKESFWREVIGPALINVFRSRRAVFFRQAYEQKNSEVGKWSSETRRRHEAIGTGLGYVWFDLRGGMFLREEDFLGANRGELYEFIYKHFRLLENDANYDLRRALFTYLRNAALQIPLHPTDEGLAAMQSLFLKVNNWRPVTDDDEVGQGRGRPGVALNPYVFTYQVSENENEYARNSYFYQHVTDVNDGAWGGLSVPEHSAQLQTELLEDVEARFKDHKLNVISCTPTLEVGIDIGALPIITMANLPPDKAGYLQRAGRAGRGPKATAMISTFLSDSVWDKLVKHDSMSFFRRENVFSVAKITNPSVAGLVKKHVYLFFLGAFFDAMYEQERHDFQAPNQANHPENPILAWDRAGTFLANANHLHHHRDCLQRRLNWLEDKGLQGRFRWRRVRDELVKVNQYLDGLNETDCPRYRSMRRFLEGKLNDELFVSSFGRIVADTVWAQDIGASLRILIQNLEVELTRCSVELNSKLDELQSAREQIDNEEITDENAHRLRRLKNLLDVQFSSIYGEYLISHLSHNRVVPAYGFPVDVISLVSGENEIQRLKLLAIREFTPGNRIPMGHTFTSIDALSPNYGADDDSRYRLWYLAGRCPHCGEITPPQEVGIGAVRCPYCEEEFEPVNRIRCVEPTGYRSLTEPVNASLARKRMSYVSPDMYLELHSGGSSGNVEEGMQSTISAAFRYCSSENPEEMPVLKCVNKGANGNGFILHRDSGRIALDAPSVVWIPDAELTDEQRRSRQKVAKWQRDVVKDPLDAHYLHNVQLLCWTKVPALVCTMTDCADGLLLGNGDASKALRLLISLALQRHASEVLKLDSRALLCETKSLAAKHVCHFALYSTDGDADCYFNEIENRIREQIGGDGVNGFLRDALMRIRPTATESQDGLLTYSNARDFVRVTDEQFERAFQWIQNNLQQLTYRQPEVIDGLQLLNPVDLLTHITNGTSQITLLYPNLTLIDLERGSVILDLLGRTSDVCEINVCFDRLNDGADMLEYSALNRMWALMRAHGRLKFRKVQGDLRDDFNSIYGCGVRLAVGEHWIYLRLSLLDDPVDLSHKSWMDVLTPAVRRTCWTTIGREVLLARLLEGETITEPLLPINHEEIEPVYTRTGLPYLQLTVQDILRQLDIDPAVINVRKVHYEDRYFMTPKSWIFFYWLMEEFRFDNDANIEIVTMSLADKPGHPVLDLHGFDLNRFRLRQTSSKVAGYAIDNDDVETFRVFVADKLGMVSENFNLSIENDPRNVLHGRELQITFVDANGVLKMITILFDSGMDMLNFNFNGYVSMFSETTKSLAFYNQRYYIARGAVTVLD